MLRRFALLLVAFFAIMPCQSMAQTITTLTHQPPDAALLTFQLTDGTVLAQGNGETDWYQLTPDITGSYVNGTWKKVASLPSGYSPLYYASAVLADGRVVISGGEYNFNNFAFTNLGAIYDPVANTWTSIGHPKGWGFIGNSPSTVLPTGQFLVGEKMQKNLAYLDPATLQWTSLSSKGKKDENAEEGWTLMPDGSVMTYDVKAFPNSERYFPSAGEWIGQGSTVVTLRGVQNCCGCIPYGNKGKCYKPPGEVGPGILRPDGTLFATGSIPQGQSIAHTSIYTPGVGTTGTWTPGPDFPNGDQAFDTYASLLPDGNVLVEGSSNGALYEFDGTKLNQTKFNLGAGYNSLMILPTGEVLIGGYEVYRPNGTYKQAWAPTITTFPSSVTRGSTYQISGTQFNGLSQANTFGDENQSPTNYPLVRITNNSTGHVFYARTHDHSSMGVATGSATVSTNFDVPSGMESGPSSLVVVANGIPSTPVAVSVN